MVFQVLFVVIQEVVVKVIMKVEIIGLVVVVEEQEVLVLVQ